MGFCRDQYLIRLQLEGVFKNWNQTNADPFCLPVQLHQRFCCKKLKTLYVNGINIGAGAKHKISLPSQHSYPLSVDTALSCDNVTHSGIILLILVTHCKHSQRCWYVSVVYLLTQHNMCVQHVFCVCGMSLDIRHALHTCTVVCAPHHVYTWADILPLEQSKNMEGYKGKCQNLEGNYRKYILFSEIA